MNLQRTDFITPRMCSTVCIASYNFKSEQYNTSTLYVSIENYYGQHTPPIFNICTVRGINRFNFSSKSSLIRYPSLFLSLYLSLSLSLSLFLSLTHSLSLSVSLSLSHFLSPTVLTYSLFSYLSPSVATSLSLSTLSLSLLSLSVYLLSF